MAISVISGGRCAAFVSDFQISSHLWLLIPLYMTETWVPELLSSEKRPTSAEFCSQWLFPRCRGSAAFIEIPWRGVKFRRPRKHRALMTTNKTMSRCEHIIDEAVWYRDVAWKLRLWEYVAAFSMNFSWLLLITMVLLCKQVWHAGPWREDAEQTTATREMRRRERRTAESCHQTEGGS